MCLPCSNPPKKSMEVPFLLNSVSLRPLSWSAVSNAIIGVVLGHDQCGACLKWCWSLIIIKKKINIPCHIRIAARHHPKSSKPLMQHCP